MIDTVFMGTAPFGFPVMRALSEREDVRVKGVFSQPDRKRGRGQETQSPPVAEYARELDLPLYQPESMNDEGLEILEDLGDLDVAFVVAYGQLLEPDVFNYPAEGTFNFHASLLPRWRGAAPIRHTLMAGDEETGVSLFRIEEGMDTGPIARQVRTTVEPKETYGELYERLSELNVGVLNLFLEQVQKATVNTRPQEGEVTLAPMIDGDDARIDWTASAPAIDCHVRAFCPDPGAYGTIGNDRLKVYDVDVTEENREESPGTIVLMTTDELHVQTGDGVVALKEVQPAGSRRMDVGDFLAGQPDLEPGDRFSVPSKRH